MQRETMEALKRENEGQGRVRAALAGFPYSGQLDMLSKELTYDQIGFNLENLAAVIREDLNKKNAELAELRQLAAAVRAIGKVIKAAQ